MRANCGDDGGKILLQTPMLEDDLGPTEVVMTSILEIARVDRTRMFEFLLFEDQRRWNAAIRWPSRDLRFRPQ